MRRLTLPQLLLLAGATFFGGAAFAVAMELWGAAIVVGWLAAVCYFLAWWSDLPRLDDDAEVPSEIARLRAKKAEAARPHG